MKPPYIPEVKSDIDTSNFDTFEDKPPEALAPADQPWKVKQTDPTFVGYTFKRSKGKDLRKELLGEKLAAAGVSPEMAAAAAASASQPTPSQPQSRTLTSTTHAPPPQQPRVGRK